MSANEIAIFAQAAELLSFALGGGCLVEAEFPSGVEALDRAADPCIVLTSLLAETEAVDGAWGAQTQRLGRLYADLAADSRLSPYICTVFRHVEATADADERRRRLRRIRRLNLLAAELSRRCGVHVIDIDRALAHIGARALATDHRLGGPAAAAAAGACVAGVILATGLDGVIPYAVQVAATEALANQPLPGSGPAPGPSAAPTSRRPPPRAAGGGPEAYLRDVLKGRLSPAAAIQALTRAISRRGLAAALAMAFAGARRLWRSRAPARR